jgi:hypothetical protein
LGTSRSAMSVRVCAACGVVRPSLSEAKAWLCEKCEPWNIEWGTQQCQHGYWSRCPWCRINELEQRLTAPSSTTHPPGEGEIAEGDPRQGTPQSMLLVQFLKMSPNISTLLLVPPRLSTTSPGGDEEAMGGFECGLSTACTQQENGGHIHPPQDRRRDLRILRP